MKTSQQGGKKGKTGARRAGGGTPLAADAQAPASASNSAPSSTPAAAAPSPAQQQGPHVWQRDSSESPDSSGSSPRSERHALEPGQRSTSDWIAEVSHELRLPIANIRLLVETLLDGALEDQLIARRMLTRTKTEVERLQALVTDLLSIEQVSGRHDVQCEWVKLKQRADYARETTVKQAAEKGVHVEIAVPDHFMVYANPPQLDQVLLNLIENAIKFTPAEGRVTIQAGRQSGCFSVADTGIGMAQEEIPKIFQRFYRIDRANTKGSTGLGLSIVKHIADLHGAKISVDSREGAGSTFSLEFPSPKNSA